MLLGHAWEGIRLQDEQGEMRPYITNSKLPRYGLQYRPVIADSVTVPPGLHSMSLNGRLIEPEFANAGFNITCVRLRGENIQADHGVSRWHGQHSAFPRYHKLLLRLKLLDLVGIGHVSPRIGFPCLGIGDVGAL